MNIETIYKHRVERRVAVRKIRSAVRRVRTQAGVRRFGVPIGSPISPVKRVHGAAAAKKTGFKPGKGWAKAPKGPRSRRQGLRDRFAPSIRVQSEAAKKERKGRSSQDLNKDWSHEQRNVDSGKSKSMLGHFKQFMPDFRDRTDTDQVVKDLESNLDHLLSQMNAEDREKAKRSIMWYVAGSAFSEDLGSAVTKRHPAAVGAYILAVLSPKNDWSNNVGQAAHLVDLWTSGEPISEEVLGATYDLALKEIDALIKKKTDALEEKILKLEKRASNREKFEWIKALSDQQPRAKNERKPNTAEVAAWMLENGLIESDGTKKLVYAPGDIRKLEADIKKLDEELPMLKSRRKLILGGRRKDSKAARQDFIDRYKAVDGDPDSGVSLYQADDWMQGFIFRASINHNEWQRRDLIPLADGSGYEVGDTDLGKLTSPMPGPAEKALDMLRIAEKIDSGEMSDDELRDWIDEKLGSGSKVRSFYMNLYDPYDEVENAVTIDTHMAAAMLLLPVGANSAPVDKGVFSQHTSRGMGNTYPLFLQATRNKAAEKPKKGSLLAELGGPVPPRGLQSVVWDYQLDRYGGGGGTAKTRYASDYGLITMQVLDRLGPEVLQEFDNEIVPRFRERYKLKSNENTKLNDKDQARYDQLGKEIEEIVKRYTSRLEAFDGKRMSDKALKALLADKKNDKNATGEG